ncbi:MAG TPA: LuxR C-terminal-related transcriptional regulator, partial [Ktedonobacteraceae bacterium]|nr:LuxR C-terminal-related transcriptional regulator [Ktedonobacteraceae bacterium]
AQREPLEPASTLTEREQALLDAIARGKGGKEIAAQLHIAERTIRASLNTIYKKLGVDSRTAAVAVAIERGLLPFQPKSD